MASKIVEGGVVPTEQKEVAPLPDYNFPELNLAKYFFQPPYQEYRFEPTTFTISPEYTVMPGNISMYNQELWTANQLGDIHLE